MHRILSGLLALASVFVTSSVRAQLSDFAGVQVHWDNDAFAKGNKTDRWYTNGFRIAFTYNKPPTVQAAKLLQNASELLLWDDTTPSLTYSIGQSMYTPRNITLASPQKDDRPWAAFLYYGATAHAVKDSEFRTTELKFGLTGRYAYGEQVQSAVHHLVASNQPAGWDQQVKSRLGVQLAHARTYRVLGDINRSLFGFQLGWGVAAGTLRNYGTLSAALTFGDLSARTAPLLIGNEGDFVVQDFGQKKQFQRPFAFLAANYTGVAYNYFLEGRTPFGHSDISTKRSYNVLQWGVSLPTHVWVCSKCPRIVYTQTRRSPEFSGATTASDERIQRWGTLVFNWDLD
jgi:lipid A 3-O-deacylase